MTKIIARATNGRGQVVEIKEHRVFFVHGKTYVTRWALIIDGACIDDDLSSPSEAAAFLNACRVEEKP